MIISSCPRCQEYYVVPLGQAPAGAYAKCPWCRETFTLEEALRRLPPMLEVISANGERLGAAAANSLVAAGSQYVDSAPHDLLDAVSPQGPDDIDEFGPASYVEETPFSADVENDDSYDDGSRQARLEATDVEEIDPEFMIHDASGTQRVAPMRVQPAPGVSGPARRKTSKGSPLKTLIGVAMGPVVALPLAGGILLALGKAPELGFWPFDGSFNKNGSNVRTVAPPMPQSSQTTRKPFVPGAGGGRSLAGDLNPEAEPAVDPAAAALEEIQSASDSERLQMLENDSASTGGTDPLGSPAPTIEAPVITGLTAPESSSSTEAIASDPVRMAMPAVEEIPVPDTTPTPAPPATPPSATEPAAPALAMPAVSEPAATEPVSTPPAANPALAKARDAASSSIEQLSKFAGPDVERRKMLAKSYAAIASVGAIVTPADEQALGAMLEKLTASSTLLDDLADAAPQWLNYSKRPTDGVLVVGEIKSIDSPAKIVLKSGLEIAIKAAPGASVATGNVVGLGKIVTSDDGKTIELAITQSLE